MPAAKKGMFIGSPYKAVENFWDSGSGSAAVAAAPTGPAPSTGMDSMPASASASGSPLGPLTGSSASYKPGATTSVEFPLPRVLWSAVVKDPIFLRMVADDLATYAEMPVSQFMNLQFSRAPNGSVIAMLSLPSSGSGSGSGSSSDSGLGSSSAYKFAPAPPPVPPPPPTEGFASASMPTALNEQILYELQADLNTGRVRFNAVNTYLLDNPSVVWTEAAAAADGPINGGYFNGGNGAKPPMFGIASGPTGGGGEGAVGAALSRESATDETAAVSSTAPDIINETIVIKHEATSPDAPTLTGNFFVDLASEIVSDAASLFTIFGRLFNYTNPPPPPPAKAASASAHSLTASARRRVPAPAADSTQYTDMPLYKINESQEALDAEGKPYLKTEGNTLNDPTLTDKERRAAWRKVYPKGGR